MNTNYFCIFQLICPSPYSYLEASTATSSDNQVPATQESNEPSKPSVLVDRSSDSHLGQSNESSSNNNEVPVSQQSNGPNAQEPSENLQKPLAEHEDQRY